MTTSGAPDPTVEQSLAAIAREMQLVNNRLAMISGWMEGQELITESLSASNTKLARVYGELASRIAQNVTHTENALQAIGKLTQIVGGVAELAKSTFDIVDDLKKKSGGANGTPSVQKAAEQ